MGRKKWIWIWAWVLLAAALAVALFGYYPRYQHSRVPVAVTEPSGDGIRLMSRNLRCLTLLDLGRRSWFYRAPLVVEQIRKESPGIIGFQEATSWQYEYLQDVLTGYDSVIAYRDDSIFSEGCPVFYSRERYILLEDGSFWLSETPEEMSKSWDSREFRICSYVVLEDTRTGQELAVFNTHLDHISEEARINGMQVILNKLGIWEDMPYVIMGDLNAQEDSRTYAAVTENCLDAREAAAEVLDGPTYQDWGREGRDRRIDYFMVSPGKITVQRYAALPGNTGDGYISDHNAIVMDMELNRLRVMTYNIRLKTEADRKDRSWKVRKSHVLEDILAQKPGVLCLQEVKPEQQADLTAALTGYDFHMVYRDSKENSEGCPIFWDAERYTPLDWGSIWLSKTPERPSKDWDAGHPRTCTYVILQDHQTGKTFGVFNIHLDHVSSEAKVKGMAVALELLQKFGDIPVILAGDYNVQPDTPTYRLVTRHLEDALYAAERAEGFGTFFSWGNLEEGRRIDYIMLSRQNFRVLHYRVLPVLRDGVYSSDHCPVVMDAVFE